MKLTKEWLQNKNADRDVIEWFVNQIETDGLKVTKKLIKEKKLDWAKWLIVRIMEYKQCVSYAVYAAEQVIRVFSNQHPNDDRPRKAIEAAKRCINNPSQKNKQAAAHAAADAAAHAAAYVDDAYAAYSATASAAASATASAAASAAAYVADVAAAYVDASNTKKVMRLKILKYGIKLL